MTTSATTPSYANTPADKGLKKGALGLLSSVVIGVASTAPAYSLAATLGFVVLFVGLQTPIVVILAFIPMLFISIAYQELNKADPDCGTSFTWATRAFGPKVGWFAGGWGILASDVLVMASLAQIAGQYGFLLFNADGIGSNPSSTWVLLVGIAWIAVMTYICYRGIEVSANFQKVLLVDRAGDAVHLRRHGARSGRDGQRRLRPSRAEARLVQPVQHPVVLAVHRRADPDDLHLLGMGHDRRRQ